MHKRDYGDILGGVAIMIGGTAFALGASDYAIGSLRRMGPGFFPISIGVVLAVFGALVIAAAFLRGAPMPKPEWRPLTTIALAILIFGLAIERIGLVPATMLLVAVSAIAQRGSRPLPTLVLAAALAAIAVLIFTQGLGMPIATVRWSF